MIDSGDMINPTKSEIISILKRYIREDIHMDLKKEIPIFYMLFRYYPDVNFWQKHELGFKLRSLAWFLGKDGGEKLASDWSIFHFFFPLDSKQEIKDNEKEDENIAPPQSNSRPQSVFSFLSSK